MKAITISDEAAQLLIETIESEIAAINTRSDLCFDLSKTEELRRCQHKAAVLYHVKQKLERAE